jgi:hypothetical protein
MNKTIKETNLNNSQMSATSVDKLYRVIRSSGTVLKEVVGGEHTEQVM